MGNIDGQLESHPFSETLVFSFILEIEQLKPYSYQAASHMGEADELESRRSLPRLVERGKRKTKEWCLTQVSKQNE